MRWIPRLLAGTAVVIAAALTVAPVTAGIADLVLNPGPHTAKRSAQPVLTAERTAHPANTGKTSSATISRSDLEPTSRTERAGSAGSNISQVVEGTVLDSTTSDTELVAATTADAHARVGELAADLQAGVAAGEFAQADADRVLADIAGYIHGDRTWPERPSA